jgi:hypothetical protein
VVLYLKNLRLVQFAFSRVAVLSCKSEIRVHDFLDL